jgi:hypothetical protein
MSIPGRSGLCAVAAAAAVLGGLREARATLSTGPGGRGVQVGQSSLIAAPDYSDTFTATPAGGRPDRPIQPMVQPAAAYAVESVYGNPQVNFRSQGQPEGVASFSFATDTEGRVTPESPPYPGSSGAGSSTGFTQTGGGLDYGIPYALNRTQFVVQVDAVQVDDRIDITSGGTPGTIFQNNSLSVFFRGNGSGNASLFSQVNGVNRDTPIQGQPGYESFNTGIAGAGEWHNYAVRYDRPNNVVELFVDEQSKAVIDLTSFAGGIYANFDTTAVGAGSGVGGSNRTWTDNFQVGRPVPEPAAGGLLACAAVAVLRRRSRRDHLR